MDQSATRTRGTQRRPRWKRWEWECAHKDRVTVKAMVGMGVRSQRSSSWEAMTRAQREAWKQRGGRQCSSPRPCDLSNALLQPSLGAAAEIATAHGMAEAAEVGVIEPDGLSAATWASELHVAPTHGPVADKGAECNADTGSAVEA